MCSQLVSFTEATAYHEAGHAVAALNEGVRVLSIRVSREVRGGGCVQIGRILTPYQRFQFSPSGGPGSVSAAWKRSLDCRLRSIRIKLAGPFAEARHVGRRYWTDGAEADFAGCMGSLSFLRNLHAELIRSYGQLPPFKPEEVLVHQRTKVRKFIRRERIWRIISEIATALLKNDCLSESEVLRLYLAATSAPTQRILPLTHDNP